jgi:hypothetical protein
MMGAESSKAGASSGILPIPKTSGPTGARTSTTSSGDSANPRVSLELSDEALRLAAGSGEAATTIDAGAPKGSSKRLSAYGGVQSLQQDRGAGFEASA